MEEIRRFLVSATRERFSGDFVPEVTVAPENSGADFASNVAMQMARDLHCAPREIASEIIQEVPAEFPFRVEVAGPGFLNFIAQDGYFVRELGGFLADFEKNIAQDGYRGKKVVCEFSDPNPFKVLHVGHLYTSVVGEAISKLVEFAGGEVVRANFGGDVGLHVGKTLYALSTNSVSSAAVLDGLDTKDAINVIADAYVEGTRLYEEDEKARAEIVELNKKIYQIAERGVHEGELAELYWRGREISYRYFEEFYKRVGVEFDKYYPESMVASRGLAEVSEHVGEVYEESDGAIVFPGEKYGLHTRVFINREGLPTYEAKDVGLVFTKWDDYHFDKSIVITGNDIIDYMRVVLKSVSMYAPELVERTEHITHGNVRLPGNEKMSSRKGNFVRAVDVLDEVEGLVEGDEMVALAAIKYAFLRYKIGGSFDFDARESVSMTGNSGVYLLYSAVRAKKILSRIPGKTTLSWSQESLRNALSGHEKRLVRAVLQYKYVLSEAVEEFAPHKIANYLYETAQEFSRFYEHVKVAGSDAEELRRGMVEAYLLVVTHGLGLLGIKIPEEM